MIKTITQKDVLIEIDLTGTDGSVSALLDHAKKFAYLIGLSEEEENKILKEMKAGDYENLVRVFDKYFGKFVVLCR